MSQVVSGTYTMEDGYAVQCYDVETLDDGKLLVTFYYGDESVPRVTSITPTDENWKWDEADPDCPNCGWGSIGCDDAWSGCRRTNTVKPDSACQRRQPC